MACAGNRWSNVHFQIPADINVKVSCFEIMSVCCVLVFNWQWCLCCSIKQLSLPITSPVLTLSLSFRYTILKVCIFAVTHLFISKKDLTLLFPQMVSSTLFLYTLRRKKIISFTAADSDNNVSAFVPLKTLFHTLPLSVAYLLYMVVFFICTVAMIFCCFESYKY